MTGLANLLRSTSGQIEELTRIRHQIDNDGGFSP